MSGDLLERIKCFRFVRDIPYRIGLSAAEQDYCCATKTPMLQKLLAALEIKSRRICCEFQWADVGLPESIIKKATSPDCFHEYLEVFIPEKNAFVIVDPTWDEKLKTTGLPIATWDGLTETKLAVKPSKTYSADESRLINEEADKAPAYAMQKFYDANFAFMNAINIWLDEHRLNQDDLKVERHA